MAPDQAPPSMDKVVQVWLGLKFKSEDVGVPCPESDLVGHTARSN